MAGQVWGWIMVAARGKRRQAIPNAIGQPHFALTPTAGTLQALRHARK